MSLAAANSRALVDAGVTLVDSTIRGMGRGLGNARTEYLAVDLSRPCAPRAGRHHSEIIQWLVGEHRVSIDPAEVRRRKTAEYQRLAPHMRSLRSHCSGWRTRSAARFLLLW